MSIDRFLKPAALLLATVAVTLGLAACGSDDENSGDGNGGGAATQVTGKQGGEIKPEKNAPGSAGDRKNAPDDVISDRPGGPAKPESP